MSKAVDNLKRARALIAKPRGWIKGELVDERDRVCAIGAMGLAAGRAPGTFDESIDIPGMTDLAKAVQEKFGIRMGLQPYVEKEYVQDFYGGHYEKKVVTPEVNNSHIYNFNDRDDTTKKDVLKVFDHAIARAQARVDKRARRAAKKEDAVEL